MPFSDKGAGDDVEALVDTLTIDGTANLSGLSTNDIQQLEQLSHELHLTTEMETDEPEVIIEAMEDVEEEEVIHGEIGAHEIEIETERAPSPEEILPDIKTSKVTTSSSSVVPPLRPLTIAPKPAKIAMKPMPGQQLLLLQGTGSNQAIKLVSTQGQELNLANFSLGRPVAIKPAVKTQIVQPKVVMKKLMTSVPQTKAKPLTTFTSNKGQIVVVQKSDQVKLVSGQNTLPSPTKTITLQQAQEMGLIPATTKIIPQAQSTPKHTLLLNKGPTKTIKIVPQVGPAQIVTSLASAVHKTVVSPIKSPTKILPATATATVQGGASKVPQRIIFKSAGTGQTILPSAQIIQVAGAQTLNTTQLHQINIPGKGMQYIKFVTATNAETIPTTPTTINTVKTTLASSANIIISSEATPVVGSATIAPKPLKTLASKSPLTNNQLVVLPNYIQSTKVAIPMRHHAIPKQPVPPSSETMANVPNVEPNLESNGMRPRKPCNCTKSQCLKLYCDCFANGEFCYMCNCMNCYNNLENEDHRQRAIKTCLERNPSAFRPKIGKSKDMSGDNSIRKHTKGCNCKRSGCLKNYCECYEAKIACSNNCKCVGCRNIEDSMDKKGLRNSLEDATMTQQPQVGKIAKDLAQFRPRRSSNSRQAINFITDEVIEATTQCMLTISDSGESNMQDEELTKSQIIEEFGRCLTEIINYSSAHN